MKINTAPMVEGGVPLVKFTMGDKTAQLTAKQAEEIAESLSRAATSARYESAIGEFFRELTGRAHDPHKSVLRIRELMEERRVRGN